MTPLRLTTLIFDFHQVISVLLTPTTTLTLSLVKTSLNGLKFYPARVKILLTTITVTVPSHGKTVTILSIK